MPRKPPPKKAPAHALPDTPRILRVGDRVMPEGSSSVYEITRVSPDGATVDICLERTNLERFRVPVSSLKFV
jgi:hypothetical protein